MYVWLGWSNTKDSVHNGLFTFTDQSGFWTTLGVVFDLEESDLELSFCDVVSASHRFS